MKNHKLTHPFHPSYLYIVLCIALVFVLIGCAGQSTEETYTPVTTEYTYEANEVSDIGQYRNYTVLVHENGYAYYDCVTGALTEKELPLSAAASCSISGDYLYILDKEAKRIYEIDLRNFSETNTIDLGDQIGVISKFAAGTDYLLFYGMVEDTFAFLVLHMESGQAETVKTRLHIEHMAAMQDNKVILYNYERSSEACYYTVYDMETDTFQSEFHTNEFAGTDCTYRKKNNSIEYYVNFDALYIRSISMEDGSIRTRKIREQDASGNRLSIAAYGNLTVYMQNRHELIYMDDTAEQYDVTVATVGYLTPTLNALIREYSIQNDCLISTVTFENEEKYKLALLAGEPIDCYLTSSLMNVADFVRNEAYVDLLAYAPFETFAEEDGYFLKTLSQTDTGALFGVPIDVVTRETTRSYLALLITRYMNDTVDLVKQTYSDEDGNQLKECLYACDAYYTGGEAIPTDAPLYYEAQCGYLIMNPNSLHKEATAEFLAYAYEIQRQTPGENAWMLDITNYPVFTEDMDVYGFWKFYQQDIFLTLIDALDSVSEGEADIDTTAEQTAARIRQIVME